MSGPVVVVGDALLDVAAEGTVERVCPDAPAPVVDLAAEEPRPGGAGLAATLSAASGRPTTLVTALGHDDAAARLADLLAEVGVDVLAAPSRAPTPQKVRVRADGQVLVRLDRGGPPDPGALGPLPPAALDAIASAAAVVVADYGRGVAALDQVRAAVAAAGRSTPVVWDPHPRGPAPGPGTWLATPNQREAGAAAGTAATSVGQLARVGRVLRQRWAVRGVAVTRGARGALLVEGAGPPLAVSALPAHGDPCGAGDCFAVAAATALADGAVLSEAVTAACRAASRFVAGDPAWAPRPPGQAPPTAAGAGDLLRARALVEEVRAGGGTVVATGGCFDLLHAGHVSLLHQARALGDCLVVCLNSDRSVRGLKGPGRPLVGQDDRARVLAAVGAVDAVVAFDEPDPCRLLDGLRPDLFVKGGDYAAHDLVEAATLARWGGQVVVVPYLGGRSTTRLIEGAREHADE